MPLLRTFIASLFLVVDVPVAVDKVLVGRDVLLDFAMSFRLEVLDSEITCCGVSSRSLVRVPTPYCQVELLLSVQTFGLGCAGEAFIQGGGGCSSISLCFDNSVLLC